MFVPYHRHMGEELWEDERDCLQAKSACDVYGRETERDRGMQRQEYDPVKCHQRTTTTSLTALLMKS